MAPLDECTSSNVDLRHHLSELSRNQRPSLLKSLDKYWGKPGVISLAGGAIRLPLHCVVTHEIVQACRVLHIFRSLLSLQTLVTDSFPVVPEASSLFGWFWKLFGRSSKEATVPFTISKYPAPPDDPCLAAALQYHPATSQPWLQDLINEFTAKVYRPAYSDFATLMHTGNTDGCASLFY
jgi:aromatic amino acid aminotransferase I / 2-aminoadipate transaminase